MTYNHRKHRNNDDSNPEIRKTTVNRVEAKLNKTNLRPRHVIIGNTRERLSAEDTVENVETTQADEVEDSGNDDTIISDNRVA